MSDKLKKFVSAQRQEFDTNEPGKNVWEKIDARMEAKNSSGISSKWLSGLKYLGFGASVIVVAVYFITKNLNNSPANGLAHNGKDSAMSNSAQHLKANQNSAEFNTNENNTSKIINDFSDGKNGSQNLARASSNNREQNMRSTNDSLMNRNVPDQKETKPEGSANFLPGEAGKTKINSTNEKKETNLLRKKKTEIYIPEEPEKTNSYTGTLYDGSSLCSVVHAFKFPGKTSKDLGGSNHKENKRVTFNTISCSDLENMPNVKAVWLKGRTDKEITLSVKKRFKNILLIKSDGRKLNPVAISHYYRGRYVITEFKGLYFKMFFKDKVELILFFKDAEEGDKIVIDGIIETVVKNKP